MYVWRLSLIERQLFASALTEKKDHNVDVLDRAGVLGAVLALIAREAKSGPEKKSLSKASADCLQVSLFTITVYSSSTYYQYHINKL